MTVADVLTDAFGRIHEAVHGVLEGIDPTWLTRRPDAEANSIAWLVWHLARVEDDHVAGIAGSEQVWTSAAWHGRFGLPFPVGEIGYGQSSQDVAAVQVDDPRLLVGYVDAVHEATVRYVGSLTDGDLGRIVDEHWDPPVTLGVRLVSVIADGLQHAGQAAYVRGLCERAGR